jgi:hypothetical protein
MIPIIDSTEVEQVKWENDPSTYNERLYHLGAEKYDQFIIINPHCASWVLEYINLEEPSPNSVVWKVGDLWIAKRFQKGWNKNSKWQKIQVGYYDFLPEPVVVWNKDLPRVFSNVSFVPDSKDLLLEHTWYLDPCFYHQEKIWVKKIRYSERVAGIKDMGNLMPDIKLPFSVIFISYKEPNAESNWKKLLDKVPYAKRIDGVDGIFEAHKAAADLADSEMFYVVDGDAEILEDFNFDFVPDIFNFDTVHVWKSINPVNDLVYGYGGVKLLPKNLVNVMNFKAIDMTTSISSKFKAMNQISNITSFNTDPFNTWKSAFRECVKLSSLSVDGQCTEETQGRLKIWSSIGIDRPYGEYAIRGAINGKNYGSANKDNPENLRKINDFKWLKEYYELLHNEK